MSYDNNNFNNDLNSFDNAGSRGARASDSNWNSDPTTNTDSGFTGQGGQQQQNFQQGQGDNWDSSQSQGGRRTGGAGWQGSGNATYQGDTQDVNVPGAGGDFGNLSGNQRSSGAGTGGGQWDDVNNISTGASKYGTDAGSGTTGRGDDDFDDQGDNYGSGTGDQYGSGRTGGGKPSMGDRIKGTVEKAAGKVTGRQDKVERGQERKTGDNYDSSLDSSY